MPFASNKGCRLHYAVEGSGSPLLLIPGLGGSTRQVAQISALLAPTHQVISVDPRGAGLSDKPDIPYEGELLCADMLCILDELGVDSVDVVGISFGGMIAQEMALRAPQRLRSQLLVSSYRASDAWTDRMWQVRLQLLHELGMAAHFQLALMFLFSPHSFRADAATVAKLEAAFTQSPPDPVGYTRQLEFCRDHDTTTRLADVTVPTLVITGADDILASPAQGRELADAIPGAHYLELPQAAHLFMISAPQSFAELIRQSLNDLRHSGNFKPANSLAAFLSGPEQQPQGSHSEGVTDHE